MEYNQEKVDDMMLALLYLTSSTDKYGTRAWKGIDLKVLDRLYKKGYISDPGRKRTNPATIQRRGKPIERTL